MNESVRLATVTGIGTTGVYLRFDGEETARQKEYVCVNTPSVGDRVCALESSGTWIVLGSIGGGG